MLRSYCVGVCCRLVNIQRESQIKRKFCPWELLSDLRAECFSKAFHHGPYTYIFLHLDSIYSSLSNSFSPPLYLKCLCLFQLFFLFRCGRRGAGGLGVESQRVWACSSVAEWTGSTAQWLGVSFFFSSSSFFLCVFGWSRLTILGSRYSDIQGPLICATKCVCERERKRKRESGFDQRQGQSRFCRIKFEPSGSEEM